MEMIGKVRRMKLRDKLSNSAIAKLTGLSRNTVEKWLKAPGDVVPKYSREPPAGICILPCYQRLRVRFQSF